MDAAEVVESGTLGAAVGLDLINVLVVGGETGTLVEVVVAKTVTLQERAG